MWTLAASRCAVDQKFLTMLLQKVPHASQTQTGFDNDVTASVFSDKLREKRNQIVVSDVVTVTSEQQLLASVDSVEDVQTEHRAVAHCLAATLIRRQRTEFDFRTVYDERSCPLVERVAVAVQTIAGGFCETGIESAAIQTAAD
ncbi:MAG: hypothetical protein ACRC46_02745 [Thermoguttaceae bacterium]